MGTIIRGKAGKREEEDIRAGNGRMNMIKTYALNVLKMM